MKSNEFLHCGGALLKHGLLLGLQLYFVNLLDAFSAQLRRLTDMRPLIPYSPSRYAAHGSTFFLSLRMDSTISTTAAEGA
jgi:hypothetical protein